MACYIYCDGNYIELKKILKFEDSSEKNVALETFVGREKEIDSSIWDTVYGNIRIECRLTESDKENLESFYNLKKRMNFLENGEWKFDFYIVELLFNYEAKIDSYFPWHARINGLKVPLSGADAIEAMAFVDPTSGPVPLEVACLAIVVGGTPPYSYDWNFGDGSPHGMNHFEKHTYSYVGYYTIILTVTDANSHTATSQVLVNAQVNQVIWTLKETLNIAESNPRDIRQALQHNLSVSNLVARDTRQTLQHNLSISNLVARDTRQILQYTFSVSNLVTRDIRQILQHDLSISNPLVTRELTATDVIFDDDGATFWTLSVGTGENDTNDKQHGTDSYKVLIDNNQTLNFYHSYDTDRNCSTGNYVFLWFKGAADEKTVRLEFTKETNSFQYDFTDDTTNWKLLTIRKDSFSEIGSPSWSNIRNIRIRKTTANSALTTTKFDYLALG